MTWTSETTGYDTSTPIVLASDGGNHALMVGSLTDGGPPFGILVSADAGLTWTPSSSAIDANPGGLNNAFAAFGNGRAVIIYTTVSATIDTYALSAPVTNLTSWTSTPLAIFSGANIDLPGIRGLAFLDGVFVASGLSAPSTPWITTSIDGITWTTPAAFTPGSTPTAFATDGTTWVAVGDFAGGTITSYTSTDQAASWTPHSVGGGLFLYWIAYHGGRFVASKLYGLSAPTLYRSPDGITWTAVAADPLNSADIFIVLDVTYAGGSWWAAGQDASTGVTSLAKSADGDTFTLDTTPYNALAANYMIAVREVTGALVGAGKVF